MRRIETLNPSNMKWNNGNNAQTKESSMLYHLGCPAWSIPEWRGTFLPASTRPNELLIEYSKIFNTVEGNSFFYALPKLDVVKRWANQAANGFEFCFKVPRELSHSTQLACKGAVYSQLQQCLECIAQAGKLGSTFLQLPASFSSDRLCELEGFCRNWPKRFPLAVEVRHPEFFTGESAELQLDRILIQACVDRVIFDSRALFHALPSDPAEEKSQSRKPRLPVNLKATGPRPMVRFVGRNRIEQADRWQEEVADKVATWIRGGKRPYVFMHTPNDTLAPYLCQQFHYKLQKRVPELPDLMFPKKQEQMKWF